VAVSTISIAESLDVIKYIGVGEFACFIDTLFDPLRFQAAKK